MNRLSEGMKSVVAILLGVVAVLALCVFVLNAILPDFGQSLDFNAVPGDLGTSVVAEVLRFDPLLDTCLLIGAYVLVCLIAWIQEELPIYIANRRRFQ